MNPTGLHAGDVDKAFKRSNDVQRTLANIHAVARHLLNISGDDELFVGVQPQASTWAIKVTYASFKLVKAGTKLDEVLEEVLRDLTAQVSRKLDESMRIVAALRGGGEPGWTHDGIESAVLAVETVQAVNVVSQELGRVVVNVIPHHVQWLEERDAMCAQVGAALERIRPAGTCFDVKVVGLVKRSEAPFR